MGYGLQRIYAGVVHTIDGDIVYVLSIDDDVVLSRTSAVMAVACRQHGHGALVDVCSRRERRETFVVRCGILRGTSVDDDVVLSRTSAVMAVACRQHGHGAVVDVCSRHE